FFSNFSMHNEGGLNGSGWSINTVTSDLSQLVDGSTSSDLFSILTPQRSVNSLASSSTALSSSLPSQFSLPPISYNQLLLDLQQRTCSQQGSSSSSVRTLPPLHPLLHPSQFHPSSLLHSTMMHDLSSSSTPFDSQSLHSGRPKKKSITETRRTSLPPHSIADQIPSQLRMNLPCTSNGKGANSPLVDQPSTSKEDQELQRELESAIRREAHEEFRRRPAPIVPDSYPRAPTPEDLGMLSETSYIPSHFFKGTKIVLPDGTKKAVEDLITDDFIMCSVASTDTVMQTSTVAHVEKNRFVYRIAFTINHETMWMEAAPEQPFFVVGLGWSSCSPEKTEQTFGLKARELQQGDVCLSLTTCQYQSKETREALHHVVGPTEAAIHAADEARKYTIFQRAIKKLPKKSRKKRNRDRRRLREGRGGSEPLPDLFFPSRTRRMKRSQSVDPLWQSSLPPNPPKPFSPKNNKDYPNQIAFDFEI
ncbi:hypothetical protein PMAYCL1PPCAC_23590, partial [Pristionchus mayeri]